ncbi:DNA cytosine methyltransferase [Roseobacter weihaiensis]|uniref:DNA cytosine methyltransferase n=1 Tax=Roseobacter weihaiensis TaxID=2763262 RepID=UPI001D09DCB8|nr:DNA cytosine methyltransferase [Roseobacter sp. H9]
MNKNPIFPSVPESESNVDRSRRVRTVESIPTILSLFSGGGGLDLGFERAGYRVLTAMDNEKSAAETFALNWPKVPFIHDDIRNVSNETIVEALGGVRPDVIIGGPPCQGFSTLGTRHSADPRNTLVNEFVRIAKALRPQVVLVENVRAISTEYNGRYRDHVMSAFSQIGYKMHFGVLDAAAFGVPQHRQRAFFVGFLDQRVEYDFPDATHGNGLEPFVTVGDAILDLMDRGEEFPNHLALRHSEKVVRRYKFIPEGGMLPPPEELPEDIRRKNFGNTYKRLDRSKPSLTIVPGNNALPIHPVLHRSLTPREAARLQSFPDGHVFSGDRRRQCILAGNAVPPLLSFALAKSIKSRIHPLKGSSARVQEQSGKLVPVAKVNVADVTTNIKGQARQKRSFVDLFCGAGGFSVGFERAGLVPIASSDNNDRVMQAHKKNFPDTPFVHGDISDPLIQEEVASIAGGETFAVVGGPPCQGFSVFGRRRLAKVDESTAAADPRNRLVLAFVDTVARIQPRWVVMENVAGFATMNDGLFVKAVVDGLREVGYGQIEHRVIDAADYGVPQHRKRFVLVANRTGHVIPWPKRKFFQTPKDWQKPFAKVGEFITDLASDESHHVHTNHVPMNHKPLQIARYKRIPEGGKLDVDALPEELKAGYRTKKIRNFSHIFRRLHRELPSITLVPGHNAFPLHPWLNRSLTVREAARLQTFPDEIEFVGARQDQCIQVGNAFPPLLAELLANNMVRAETSGWFPSEVPALAAKSILELS